MGLQALKIVDEEFVRHQDSYDGLTPGEETLLARIKDRIMKECVELPEEFCCFCGEIEAECAGGGFDDETPAHDFAKGGISKDNAPPIDDDIPF